MFYRQRLLVILALALLSLPSACNRESAATDTDSNGGTVAGETATGSNKSDSASKFSEVLILTDSNFQKYVMKPDRIMLVDFYADWCKPCKALAPTIDKLAKENEGKYVFGRMNVDHNKRTSQKYSVQALPTLLIFKGGKQVDKIIGYTPKDAIQAKLDQAAR